VIALFARLPKVILCIGNAVPTAAAAVGSVLRMVRVARVLVIRIAVLVSLDMLSVLLRQPLRVVTLLLVCARPLAILLRLLVLLLWRLLGDLSLH
jgi:hypothetical protein